MEWLLEEFGPDGFIPMMVMYDGTSSSTMALAEEMGLTYPILSDPNGELFDRWDPDYFTPSTTFVARGGVVEMVDTVWYQSLVEELVYAE